MEMYYLDPKIPLIGDIVSTELALQLCRYYELEYLVERIQANPGKYQSWKFDGCSCLPDKFLGIFSKSKRWEDITYDCALPHDLGYAYGDPDNEKVERLMVDEKLRTDLKKTMKYIEIVKAFLIGVRIGGAGFFNTNFSWAFALKDKKNG